MLDFNEITLADKGLFDKYFKLFNPQASELTFTNLFMWRNYYKFRYTEIDGLLCMISVIDGAQPYAYMPMGKLDINSFHSAVFSLKEYFLSRGWKLFFKGITDDQIVYFKSFISSDEDVAFDRDNSDYLYTSDGLISLAGKKYDGKRNHINKFKKQYEYEYFNLANEHIDECIRIMDEWCNERKCEDHRGLYCEKLANMELLNNFDAMRCRGAIMKVDGRFEGFTVGEMLNSDTAVIHIEKANSKINGLYTFLNQQFCVHEWKAAQYINREQDLGMEGLRKAKLSYNPFKIVNKYVITLMQI